MSADCIWTQDDEDSDTWGTQCGHYFTVNEGTPADNSMRFCCFCGKPLVVVPYELECEEPHP